MAKSHSCSSAHTSALRALCAFMFLSFASCAEESGAADSETLASIDEGHAVHAPAEQDEGKTLYEPSGAYIASVRAVGTGCSAGTWDANLGPDGTNLSVTFSSFYAEVDQTRAISISDCTIVLQLHSPAGLAYVIQDAGFTGYMYLEDGVQLRYETNYSFQGLPEEAVSVASDFTGPKDEHFFIQDTREDVNYVRSRCATDQILNLRLRLRLRNSNPRGNGFVFVKELPGQHFNLSWQKC